MAKYDVYKDGEGDWTIVPEGQKIVAPVDVIAMNGAAAATLADVERIANTKRAGFEANRTHVKSQSVVNRFGPYELAGSIEVA
ncbi:hypothetical protein ACLPBM_20415 [Escherichia coli]|uniref:hypothetical protein n=1 Tax=Enterobacterales TaxID=91347 RepID=UPI0038925D3D